MDAVRQLLPEWVTTVPAVVWWATLALGFLLMVRGRSGKLPRALSKAMRAQREHTLPRYAWRFATGAHLDKEARTNATWVRRGRTDLTVTKTATRWAYMPRGQRAAIRWATITAAALWVYGYVNAQTFTLVVTALLVAAGAALGGWKAYQGWRVRHHMKTYVRPLHLVLAPVAGIEPTKRPDEWLDVPVNFKSDDDAEIVVKFPATFTGSAEARKLVNGTVANKLALSLDSIDIAYQMVGMAPYATFRQAPKPPDKVLSDLLMALMAAAPESAPVIGLGRRSKVISVDLDADSPHILASMGSGGGKSVLTKLIACQLLHNGAFGVILDAKRHSHPWAKGLPNVLYVRDIRDIHNALVELGEIGSARNVATDDDPDAFAGKRIFVLAEEWNMTSVKLRSYWQKTRTKDDPKTSPAVEAMNELMFMGRAILMNVLAVAQSATARTFDGPEARENFATRIMGRYTVNNWKMLVPEVHPIPKSSRKRGRVQVVLGGEAEETQVGYLDDQEAAGWAVAGVIGANPFVPVSQPVSGAHLLGQPDGTVPALPVEGEPGERPALHLVRDPAGRLVGLREAVRDGLLMELISEANSREPSASADRLEELAVQVLRSATKRDSDFPKSMGYRGKEKLYRAGDLQFWSRNRPKADSARASGE